MSVLIGLRDVYYAILDESSDILNSTPVYETPIRIAGAISAKVNPNSSTATLFADDGPSESATTIGEISLELNIKDLPLPVQAALLGHTYEGAILKRKSSDVPPWVAIGFRSLKSNGKYRYTWLTKGKFGVPEQDNETKGDSVNFQTPTITGAFVKRDSDDEWERHADADDVDYVASIGTDWFNSPLGTGDTTPPTVSNTVPANNATGVAVGSTFVWNFSEALKLSTVTSANFFVLKETDGSVIAGALSINAGRTAVTFTPTSNLTAASVYRAYVTTNVKDLAGNSLAVTNITKFTVA